MKRKRNGLLTALIVILVILVLISAGMVGFLWFRNTHIFVERTPYYIYSEHLDLTEKDISFAHYDSLHAQLPGCDVLWNVPFQGGAVPSNSETVQVNGLSREDISVLLTYFPKLKRVVASGCREYDTLEELQQRKPELEIQYTVSLGGKEFAPDVKELELARTDYTPEALAENLSHLPQVSKVLLRTPELTAEDVDALRERYPEIEFAFTVDILGQEYDAGTTELDLSGMTQDQVETVAGKLPLLPALASVNLMDEQGNSQLEKEAVRTLVEAAPEAVFHYSFDFYGEKLSTDTESVKIVNKRIGDEGEAELRLALDLMPNCTKFQLENCGFSNDVLAKVREDYRGRTKVVWRVYFGKGSTLTDAQVLRAVYDLVDDNAHDLVYCEDVRFMDIGHDEFLDSVEFVSGMPNLEYVIVSGSPIKDLTPFANCKKLKVLEAAFCEYLTDASPLASCESLEMLNISYTHIVDLSPLDDLKLTHLIAKYYPRSRVSEEEQARVKEQHPDCWIEFVGEQPYGPGWRYNEKNEALDWYKLITAAFRYPDAPNHVGWYFDENEQ